MLDPLDGPSKQLTISVTSATVKKVPETGSAFSERKVVTLQPVDGHIYVYFGDGTTTPNAATVIANGFLHYKKSRDSYEASDSQDVFILAVSGTVSVRVAERS